MSRYSILCWIPLIALAGLLVGCGRAVVEAENPVAIPAASYDRVFDLSVQMLRDMNFVVDRQDRRFGVITTQPRTAASAMEPWHADNTTAAQVAEATLNLERRLVRMTIKPAGADGEQADAASGSYLLSVEVQMDRRQAPAGQLNSAAVGHLRVASGVSPARQVLTERGYEQAYWRPIGRDPYFEKRLIAEVLERASRPLAVPPVSDEPQA